jgi:NAD(P)-dependent dehydrogenase (short-subunit alcohol dehydrogenase family)
MNRHSLYDRPSPWTGSHIPRLTDRTALVTGANAGLGYATARALLDRGAHVVLACRNPVKAGAAAARLAHEVPGASLEVAPLDLASLDSVSRLADDVRGRLGRLDLLVNNAGLMAVPEGRTADGFEVQFGVNHLGHVALTARLLPLLTASPGSRVVTVTSVGHRWGHIRFDALDGGQRYRPWRAYFQSKLANLLFALELQRRLAAGGHRTASLAAHPGASSTELAVEENRLVRDGVSLLRPLFMTPDRGALPTLRAATDPAALGGQLYGPSARYRGHPVVETPSRRALDPEVAARLWDVSLALVKVADPIETPAPAHVTTS